MSLLALSLIGAGAMTAALRASPARLVCASAVVAGAVTTALRGTRIVLAAMVDTGYRKYEALQQMHAQDLVASLNEWIVFAKNEGTIQRACDYWILGKGAEEKRRRRSIMHDVLGLGR